MGLRNWLHQKTAGLLGVEELQQQVTVMHDLAGTFEAYAREVARLLIEYFPETRDEVLACYPDLYERPINQDNRALALAQWDWASIETPQPSGVTVLA